MANSSYCSIILMLLVFHISSQGYVDKGYYVSFPSQSFSFTKGYKDMPSFNLYAIFLGDSKGWDDGASAIYTDVLKGLRSSKYFSEFKKGLEISVTSIIFKKSIEVNLNGMSYQLSSLETEIKNAMVALGSDSNGIYAVIANAAISSKIFNGNMTLATNWCSKQGKLLSSSNSTLKYTLTGIPSYPNSICSFQRGPAMTNGLMGQNDALVNIGHDYSIALMVQGILSHVLAYTPSGNSRWVNSNGNPLLLSCSLPGNSIKIQETKQIYNAVISSRKLLLFSTPQLTGVCGNNIVDKFDYLKSGCSPSTEPTYGMHEYALDIKCV